MVLCKRRIKNYNTFMPEKNTNKFLYYGINRLPGDPKETNSGC
jgi:hypothetical protein